MNENNDWDIQAVDDYGRPLPVQPPLPPGMGEKLAAMQAQHEKQVEAAIERFEAEGVESITLTEIQEKVLKSLNPSNGDYEYLSMTYRIIAEQLCKMELAEGRGELHPSGYHAVSYRRSLFGDMYLENRDRQRCEVNDNASKGISNDAGGFPAIVVPSNEFEILGPAPAVYHRETDAHLQEMRKQTGLLKQIQENTTDIHVVLESIFKPESMKPMPDMENDLQTELEPLAAIVEGIKRVCLEKDCPLPPSGDVGNALWGTIAELQEHLAVNQETMQSYLRGATDVFTANDGAKYVRITSNKKRYGLIAAKRKQNKGYRWFIWKASLNFIMEKPDI